MSASGSCKKKCHAWRPSTGSRCKLPPAEPQRQASTFKSARDHV